MSLTLEQLERRKQGIGGSDVAAILGLSPWQTPLDVFLSKTGDIANEPNDDMADGTIAEEFIVAMYQRRHPLVRICRSIEVIHPREKWMRCNLDAGCMENGELFILEAKRSNYGEWGDELTDQIPNYYLTQCVWNMGVCGMNRCDVPILYFGKYREYRVMFDSELFQSVFQACSDFWHDHVVAGVAPVEWDTESASRYIDGKYKNNLPELLTVGAGTDILETIEQYRRLLAVEEALEKSKLECENRIKDEIGAYAGIDLPETGESITWREQSRKSTKWKEVATEAGAAKEIIEKHTSVSTSRVFRPKLNPVELIGANQPGRIKGNVDA
jgi:putative phage-type endonuclease